MDEPVDILDANGNSTGRTALKSDVHRNGWFHATVHVWFFTSDRKILIQQRATTKDVFPSLWDVSVAGHVGSGECIKDAAVREINEEIGLDVPTENLLKIKVFKASHKHSESLLDEEFHHVFICELNVPFSRLKKQKSEVADLALMPLIRFSKETCAPSHIERYVPHGTEYYKKIVCAIQNQIALNNH